MASSRRCWVTTAPAVDSVLATAFEISDDGLTYTFTLRDGVTYHTGDAFTGDDVVATWNIIMTPDSGVQSERMG